jgi:hypothetical protein
MTSDIAIDETMVLTQTELEFRYKTEFPGFDPATWAAMAYYSKGYAYEDVRVLLAERFGECHVAKHNALVRESRAADSSPYKPDELVFKIEDVTDEVVVTPE